MGSYGGGFDGNAGGFMGGGEMDVGKSSEKKVSSKVSLLLRHA